MPIWLRRVLVALVTCGLLASGAVTLPSPATAEQCAAIYGIGLRGSGEPQDSLGKVVSDTFKSFTTKTKGVSYEALPYPAQLVYPPVGSSVRSGVRLLKDRLISLEKACPSQKLVLVGYSQGAWVIQDALLDKGHVGTPIAASIRKRIKGVVLYGDPKFNPKDKAARGNFSKTLSGISGARTLPSWVNAVSYCRSGDPICNFSKKNLDACKKTNWNTKCPHQQYASRITTFGGNWLTSLFPSAPPKVTPPKKPAPSGSIAITRLWTQDKNRVDDNAFPCTGSTNRVIHYRVSLNNTFKTPVTAKAVLIESWGGTPLNKSTTFQPGQVEFFIPSDSPQSKPGIHSYTLTITYPGGTVSKTGSLTFECASS